MTVTAGQGSPDVEDDVRGAFDAYERALVAHDLDALAGFFLDGPDTRRFGVCDEQRGAAEIDRWRRAGPPVPPGRRLEATGVLVLGDVAVVSTRFGYGAGPATGRQSQVWLRTPAGWRIAHAHVSETRVTPDD